MMTLSIAASNPSKNNRTAPLTFDLKTLDELEKQEKSDTKDLVPLSVPNSYLLLLKLERGRSFRGRGGRRGI